MQTSRLEAYTRQHPLDKVQRPTWRKDDALSLHLTAVDGLIDVEAGDTSLTSVLYGVEDLRKRNHISIDEEPAADES